MFAPLTCAVPQGSILGPIIFSLHMVPLGYILHRHGIAFRYYADDTDIFSREAHISYVLFSVHVIFWLRAILLTQYSHFSLLVSVYKTAVQLNCEKGFVCRIRSAFEGHGWLVESRIVGLEKKASLSTDLAHFPLPPLLSPSLSHTHKSSVFNFNLFI